MRAQAAPLAPSGSCGEKPRDAKEVVGGANEVSSQVAAFEAAQASLSQAADHLHPAEDFLDAFASFLTQGIAGPGRCARINGRAPAGCVRLRDTFFRKRGILVLRLSNDDALNRPAAALAQIRAALHRRSPLTQ